MPDTERQYTTRRGGIVAAICGVLKNINGTGEYITNIHDNVSPKLRFWDEIVDFPEIHVSAGPEVREYQGGGHKDRFLTVTVRCYVKEEDAVLALDGLLEDVETVLEKNARLSYKDRLGAEQFTHQISIITIDTDEGVLEPLGVGEFTIEVQY